MKNSKLFLVVGGLALGLSGQVYATCTGGGDPCNAPRNISFTAHSATTLTEAAQNSATPNPTNSVYYLEATTQGSPQDTATADANTSIIQSADFISPATANDVVSAVVRPLLASSNYHGYAKICPAGSGSPLAAGCSAWTAGTSQTTDALTNVGFRNIAAADTAPQQFTARTNAGTMVDQTDVAAWLLTALNSTEVGNCGLSNVFQPFPSSGDQLLTVVAANCNTLFPNRPYTLVEHLVYTPTQSAPNYTSTVFYTQAADPEAINPVTSVTHCSAHLTFQNAVAAPANPNDTTYSVNIGGAVSSGSAVQTKVIGGTGVFSDQNSVTYTNLVPGTTYNPAVTALNRGGAPWKNSNPDTYTSFQTAGTNGVFTVTGITTNSATFNFPAGFDVTGATAWQILLNGNPTGPSGSGLPPTSIPMPGLNANTSYLARIQITEAGCTYTVPVAPGVQFYTLPVAPTAPDSLSNVTATSIQANWTDGSTNSNGSVYDVQYCTTGFGTGTCATNTSATKPTVQATLNGLTASTQYFVQVRTVAIDGNAAHDSAYLQIGNATTGPSQRSITIAPLSATVITGNTQGFTATVVDINGTTLTGQAVNWSVNGGGNVAPANAAGTTFTATTPGSGFILTASLAGYPNGTATINVIAAGPVIDSMTFVMSAGNKGGTLTLTGHDNVVGHITANYSGSPAGVTFTPSQTTSNNGVAANSAVTFPSAGTFTLKADVGSGVTKTVTVIVPQVLSSLKVCAVGDMSCASSIQLKTLTTQQFAAVGLDQFGNAMNPGAVTWSNNVAANGAQASFSSGVLGQPVIITASASGLTGQITVNLVNFDVSAAKAYPVPYKASMGNPVIHFSGLGSQATLHIYTTSGRRVFDYTSNADTYDWNIRNSSGESIASGVYFYLIESPEGKKNGKLIIIQ